MNCPVCDGPLDETRHHEEYAGITVLAEERIHCPRCGYESAFRHGAHSETVDGHHYCWNHNTPAPLVAAIDFEIIAAIEAAQAAWTEKEAASS